LAKYEYCRYRKILGNTGGFWEILVIPVLRNLENTGNTSIADTGKYW
jgi:hypothetical protein